LVTTLIVNITTEIKYINPVSRLWIPAERIINEYKAQITVPSKDSPLVRIRRAIEICNTKPKTVNIRSHVGNNEILFSFLECNMIGKVDNTQSRFKHNKISSINAGKGINNTKVTIKALMAIKRFLLLGLGSGSKLSPGIACSLIEFYFQYFTSLIYHGML
jgi:hypothetical protein